MHGMQTRCVCIHLEEHDNAFQIRTSLEILAQNDAVYDVLESLLSTAVVYQRYRSGLEIGM
jgi:hypothetical protein